MFKDILNKLRINQSGIESRDSGLDQYILETDDVDIYGVWFSKLDKSKDIEIIDNNQIVTLENSSIFYKTKTSPIILLNLIADFDNDNYKLVMNNVKENEDE